MTVFLYQELKSGSNGIRARPYGEQMDLIMITAITTTTMSAASGKKYYYCFGPRKKTRKNVATDSSGHQEERAFKNLGGKFGSKDRIIARA